MKIEAESLIAEGNLMVRLGVQGRAAEASEAGRAACLLVGKARELANCARAFLSKDYEGQAKLLALVQDCIAHGESSELERIYKAIVATEK